MAFLDRSRWEGKVFTTEGWMPGSGGEYDAVEPATSTKLARVGAATAADVHKAAEAAAQAQHDWAAPGVRPPRRGAAPGGAAVRRARGRDPRVVDPQVRRDPSVAGFQTRAVAAEECWEAAALASHPYGELLRSNQPRLSMARRLPAGVVGVIAPFNAPIILAILAIAPALALGNAVVCKPDPRTAICGGVVFARIFEVAGLPPGLFHMLPGGAEVGAAVVDDPQIRVIAFTGSTRAGKIIAAGAAQRLKRVHLEPGGNSALIVLDDVDLEKAVSVSVGAFGSFNHAGQICMATSRPPVVAFSTLDEAVALANGTEYGLSLGILEQGTVDLLRQTGVGDRMMRDRFVHHGINLAFEGGLHRINLTEFSGGRSVMVYAQHEVVTDLIAKRLADGGDIRFGVSDTAVDGIDTDRRRSRCSVGRPCATGSGTARRAAAAAFRTLVTINEVIEVRRRAADVAV